MSNGRDDSAVEQNFGRVEERKPGNGGPDDIEAAIATALRVSNTTADNLIARTDALASLLRREAEAGMLAASQRGKAFDTLADDIEKEVRHRLRTILADERRELADRERRLQGDSPP
jgi:hypothetical protein